MHTHRNDRSLASRLVPLRRRLLAPLFLVGLVAGPVVGCSSPAPEPTYYLLRGSLEEVEGPIDPTTRVGLGRVVVAPYLLADPGIVVETAPGEIRPARLHRWAEPIDSGVRWYLRTELGRAMGSQIGGGLVDVSRWDYTVDVYIVRLHGDMTGTAVIQAGFVVRPADDEVPLREYVFARSAKLPDSGYAALVQTERQLLIGLAEEIAGALQSMIADTEIAAEGAAAP